MIDITLKIHPVALAITHLISLYINDDNRLSTIGMHNGREKGVCVVKEILSKGKRTCFYVFFGENRNSDAIFVQKVKVINPCHDPDYSDFTEKSYEDREYFEPDKIMDAVKRIAELVNEFNG